LIYGQLIVLAASILTLIYLGNGSAEHDSCQGQLKLGISSLISFRSNHKDH